MLAWVLNLGFAAGTTITPKTVTATVKGSTTTGSVKGPTVTGAVKP